ncbi:hypothetical protein QRO11_10065 [Paracidovorax citrulli]|uniref:hypothetical protein n=1 Tax=Paracidovorax citrulli TaxID=80869 RepID=UPI00255CA77F|nr:hypothetical protein [Paracidovorax citrulli]WIY36637.1 hypothetical protein QRO11_10065 [Paracidovorax citrulli]
MTPWTALPASCAAAMAAVIAAGQARAQEITEVTWSPMREVVFHSSKFPSSGTEADRQILRSIWAKELISTRKSADGQPLPAFALVGDVQRGGRKVVFSMFSAAGTDRCEDPENGAQVTDIYSVCSLRVTPWPMQGRQVADLPGYCMIFGTQRDKSRIEYAFDAGESLLRLRAIQFGKVVPACSRSLRLG